MTLRELRFIVAVAREKNFRRAAEKSFVSQPALSLGIQKIEEELGVQIFERSRSNVSITKIGEKIINQSILVLEEADKIKELSALDNKNLNVPFRLGLIYSIAPYLLPLIIPLLKEEDIENSLEVEENITKNFEEQLKQGLIDAVIMALPLDLEGIETVPLYHEPFEVIVPANHSWSKRKEIKPTDLADHKVLLLDNTHCFSNQVLEACPGIHENSQIFAGNSLETIRNMVASNLGVSVLPKSATCQSYHDPLVKVIPFKRPAPLRTVALAYRKSTAKKNKINEVIKTIQSLNVESFKLL
jgi:LysR family transcriptional regulator, hydrogen peroxide-inducible genes activator